MLNFCLVPSDVLKLREAHSDDNTVSSSKLPSPSPSLRAHQIVQNLIDPHHSSRYASTYDHFHAVCVNLDIGLEMVMVSTVCDLYWQSFQDAIRLCRCHCVVSEDQNAALAFYILLQSISAHRSFEDMGKFLKTNVVLEILQSHHHHHHHRHPHAGGTDFSLDPLRLLFDGSDSAWTEATDIIRMALDIPSHSYSTHMDTRHTFTRLLEKIFLRNVSPTMVCAASPLRRHIEISELRGTARCLEPNQLNVRSVSIHDCENSCVFICAAVDMVEISSCSNCRIVVGVCPGAVHVRNSHSMDLSVITRSIQIS